MNIIPSTTIFHMQLRRLKSLHPGIFSDPILQRPSEQDKLGPKKQQEALERGTACLFETPLYTIPLQYT